MRYRLRVFIDKAFTFAAWLTVGVLVVLLALVMFPIIRKGVGAVIFRGTHDFRMFQFDLYGRGDAAALETERDAVWSLRKEVLNRISDYKASISSEVSRERIVAAFQRTNEQMKAKDFERSLYLGLRVKNGRIKDNLVTAAAGKPDETRTLIADVDQLLEDLSLSGIEIEEYRRIASEIIAEKIGAAAEKRREQLEIATQLEETARAMFGPTPQETPPTMVMYRYGMTRWDMALSRLNEFLHVESWVEKEPGQPLERIVTRRETLFEGTELHSLFSFVEDNFKMMFNPRLTIYYQYFFDDSTSGRYLGGIGPEILGTLLLVVTSMLVVIPVGIVSAAYLTEYATEGYAVRVIRMGINVLAGVPSVVFGLFGMAFFMLFLFPAIGLPSRPSVLAGALTLSLLTLPVMIRSSEEAIRAVPKGYKEAALALGAGEFRTFVTVTLPAALPGILTGVILSLSRVAGETAPILFTAAIALGPVPSSILEPTRTLSYGTYDMAVGDRIAMSVPHQQFGMVMTLIVIVIAMNAVSIGLRSYYFRKLQGR